MDRPRVAIHTLGCKVNQAESREIAEKISRWAQIVPFGTNADLTIINSCLVTTHAERETRQMVHRAARFSPGAPIILTGCYVALHGEEAGRLEEGVVVVPMDGKATIPSLARRLLGLEEAQPEPSEPPLVGRPPIWVQTGCDKRCSYCIIPAARGPSRSRPIEEILPIFERYVSLRSEVVLTGINLGSWGLDLDPPRRLHDLLRALLDRLPPGKRVRLGSIEPELVDEGLLELLSDDRVAPHLHLPLQGGTDDLLRAMGRSNTTAQYEEVVRAVLDARKGAAVGADVIVGYPTETDDDFEAALSFVSSLPVAYLHVFSYSPRPGTPAAALPQLPRDVVKERTRRMRQLGSDLRRRFLASKVGTIEWMAPERRQKGTTTGMAGAYFRVAVPTPLPLDKLARVRIVSVDVAGAEGEVEGT